MPTDNPPQQCLWRRILQFRLTQVFAAIAAIAILLAIVHAQLSLAGVWWTIAFFLLAVWTVDSWLTVRDMSRRRSRRREFQISRVTDRQSTLHEEAIRRLRIRERDAKLRYQTGAGRLEDVFRAQGLRAIAEIDLARHQSALRTAIRDRNG